jgi:DNA-binding NarL/FixJ family response regulator
MKTTRTIIIDDERLAREELRSLLKEYQEIDVVAEAINGIDGIEKIKEFNPDLIFLDESMPGLSGLETLQELKKIRPNIPVVLVTKNEEEDLMEDAIGSQIADYLIKPVKPQQIILTIKKLTENKKLITEKTNKAYQQEQVGSLIGKLEKKLKDREELESLTDEQKAAKATKTAHQRLQTMVDEVIKKYQGLEKPSFDVTQCVKHLNEVKKITPAV